jgi:hypothetical protein
MLVVFEDNEMVELISNADGSMRLRGLCPILSVFGAIHKAIRVNVIVVVNIDSSDNHSNQPFKLPSSRGYGRKI